MYYTRTVKKSLMHIIIVMFLQELLTVIHNLSISAYL